MKKSGLGKMGKSAAAAVRIKTCIIDAKLLNILVNYARKIPSLKGVKCIWDKCQMDFSKQGELYIEELYV